MKCYFDFVPRTIIYEFLAICVKLTVIHAFKINLMPNPLDAFFWAILRAKKGGVFMILLGKKILSLEI